MKPQWWHSSVVYQIYPRSFLDSNNDGIGDLKGIISKLDYLAKLGIDVIWLSPVYQSPMDDNGYDISDYQAIAREFGDMDDMRTLIDEAKRRGIKIIMDLVVNHTSDEHPWFIEAQADPNSPYRNFYLWRDAKPKGAAPNELESVFGGSAWQWDEANQCYYFHLFSKRQPDLNWQNPTLQQHIFNMMNWWLDQGIAGFRLDVIDLIGKEVDKGITSNGPQLHPLLQRMHQECFAKRDLLTVGETWGATPEIAKLYSHPARNELSMVFQFEHVTLSWHEGDKWQPKEFNLSELKAVLNKWQNELADEGWNALFWNNHDLPRVVSKYGCEGEHRVASAKMLATTLHLMKGTPYIYQGEEIGMTNVVYDDLSDYQDIETRQFYALKTAQGVSHEAMMQAIYQNSRDNARTPMQWNDKKHAGFTKGKPWLKVNDNYGHINVKHALNDSNSIFYHYQHLISLRKSMPVIVYGDYQAILPEHPQLFAYMRSYQGERIAVFSNFSKQALSVPLPQELANHSVTHLISNTTEYQYLPAQLELAPFASFAVLLQ